ncbi:MAG: hypothetical protein WC873_01815 [Candidatus Gracilibacteria bacterium]
MEGNTQPKGGALKGIVVLVAVLLVGWFLMNWLLGSFGGGAVENIIENAIEQSSGNNADVNIGSDGSFSVTTEEGTMSFGTELSADWPNDVPTYPGAAVTYSAVGNDLADGGLGGYAIFTTSDSAQKVIDFYNGEMATAGWTVKASVNIASSMNVTFEKDGLAMNVTATEGDGSTTLTIGFGK